MKAGLGLHDGEVVHGEAANVVVFDFDFSIDFVPDREVGGRRGDPYPPSAGFGWGRRGHVVVGEAVRTRLEAIEVAPRP